MGLSRTGNPCEVQKGLGKISLEAPVGGSQEAKRPAGPQHPAALRGALRAERDQNTALRGGNRWKWGLVRKNLEKMQFFRKNLQKKKDIFVGDVSLDGVFFI